MDGGRETIDEGERKMRRSEREIKDKKTVTAILEQSPVGRIATVNLKGFPIIKPVNFLYWDGKIYIHSSTKGEKIRDIRRESRVCFEVDEPIAYAPASGPACVAGYYYRSIIIKGKANLLDKSGEKLKILERLMEKYQPEGGYEAIPEEALKKTAIIEISIREITGKERLG
ncbi:MAG: pyridoxamine 5'-phosphate oxidase family protein [Deltaproteobacteria bacterium]|nr:pyridoxamine 5'-phosphate oxidase family protein [Deltaproteobacteria bacterium]